jgi:Alginate lyase
MKLEFITCLPRIWFYNHINSSFASLRKVPSISIITWSCILALLGLMHPSQVEAWDQRMMNYSDDISSHTLPQLVVFDLPSKRAMNDNKNPLLQGTIKQLLAQADFYLTENASSVMDKTQIPPSGDKHDFLALSPYYWPVVTKRDDMRYVYRDGEFNPEIHSIPDRRNMETMVERVKTLSVAYHFTENISYASKASELLRVWFLNNDTRMNPNLQYAETIPGKDYGTHSGIIVARDFPDLINAIRLIQDSLPWTKQDQRGIELWFGKYLEWLLNSDFGKRESKRLNNHGTWYDVQASSIALFLNKTEVTRDILKNNLDRLIAAKIEPDGRQRFELYRTNSLDYHIFNLLAFFNLAKIADNIGIDLWNYETPRGSGLQKALDYLLPYALGEETWPRKQTKPINMDRLLNLLCHATIHYEGNKSYEQAYSSIGQPGIIKETSDLIYGCYNRVFT